jgi:hypothetical protein
MSSGRFKLAVSSDQQTRSAILREIGVDPHAAMSIAIDALTNGEVQEWIPAIELVRIVGYPNNAPALAPLVAHVDDPNRIGWHHAIGALADIGPEIVTPYFIEILLADSDTVEQWQYAVEGLCQSLLALGSDFAQRCGPALAHLLSSGKPEVQPDRLLILDVFELIGLDAASYAIPAIVALIKNSGASDELESHAKSLLSKADSRMLEPYQRAWDAELGNIER